MISFWDKQTYFNNPDFTIVGAGLTGLQTALALRVVAPKAQILVVDTHFLPFGASNRNAGFACYGSPSELTDDLTRESLTDVVQRTIARYEGLKLLLQHVKGHNIGWKRHLGFELFREKDADLFEKSVGNLKLLNEALIPQLGFAPYALAHVNNFAFSGISNAISIQNEGQLNPALVLQALRINCLTENIQLVFGEEVTSLQSIKNGVDVVTSQAKWQSRAVIVATNAFAEKLLPSANIVPARGQVLITEPLAQMPFQGTFHMDEGYYYFRNVGHRILLGGGRNTDKKTEFTDVNILNDNIQAALEDILYQHITPFLKPVIEHRWTGIMAFGKHQEKEPLLEETAPGIFIAARLGGMGVALSAQVAKRAAALAAPLFN